MSWNFILIAMKELTLALAPWGKKHPYLATALQRNGINEIEIPLKKRVRKRKPNHLEPYTEVLVFSETLLGE